MTKVTRMRQLYFQGSASIAMIGIVSGAVLNIVLDPILIFGLDLGVTGAALATVLSQVVSFLLLLFLNIRRAAIRVDLRLVTPSMHYFRHMFLGGIPSLCRQGIGGVATVLLNVAAKTWGAPSADAAIAAMSIVSRITMFAYSALIGFGQGFQPVCGTNYGAGLYRRVREAFFYSVKVGLFLLVVFSTLCFIFAEPLLQLFRDDPEVIAIGVVTLRAQTVVFPLNDYVIMSTMLLQTIGQAFRASVVTTARQGIFFVPAILLLPPLFGLLGVQIAQPVADILSLFLAIPMCRPVLQSMQTDRVKPEGSS